jgi:hypothetical protein
MPTGKSSKTLKITNWIGFYGCTNKVIKVGWSGTVTRGDHSKTFQDQASFERNRPNRVKDFDCPACGNTHAVTLMWRPRKDKEKVDIDV